MYNVTVHIGNLVSCNLKTLKLRRAYNFKGLYMNDGV